MIAWRLTSRNEFLRCVLGVGLCLSTTGVPSGLSAQRGSMAQTAAYDARAPVLWVTAGAGVGTGGLAGLLGGSAAVHDWSLGVRYWKTQSGGGSLEKYGESYSLLLGHRFGASGRNSLAVGIGTAKVWEVPYYACTSDCWFGDTRKGATTTTFKGTGLTFAGETHSRPLWGLLSAGMELNLFVSRENWNGALTVAMDLGWLR